MTDPEQRVRDLVSELDSIIPNENAKVRIDVYGGALDESYIRANRHGLQRFGVQLLKAADAPLKDSSAKFAPDTVDTDVSDLFHEDSDVELDWIERSEDLDSETHLTTELGAQRRTGWVWTVIAVVVILLVLFLLKTIKGMP